MVGRPLKSQEAQSEEIGTSEGLAALSLDALTSVAYGPEAIAIVLVGVGVAGMRLLLPLTLAIVGLLAILVLSYSQVIEAYPRGGGAYAVSRENLGIASSQLAAASLFVDYILTVAISISAGIGSLTSALPAMVPFTLPLCLFVLALVTILNLRGVGESARAFLLPTVLFIVGLLAILGWGFIHPVITKPELIVPAHAPKVGVFFLLTAFAAGLTALTGVEAIANGVPLFREPRVLRAKRTEWLLGILLAAMLLGIATLTERFGVVPGGPATLLSKVIAGVVGHDWIFFVMSFTITIVLGLAANTSFGGLPILASLLARDGFLPRGFAMRGDRLVLERGVWFLAVAAAVLLVAVNGNTQALIPMYAIGVFMGFTLSQTGMVIHWRKSRPPGWRLRSSLNLFGAFLTATATALFVLTKFSRGAWVVVIVIPVFMVIFRRVGRYYQRMDHMLHAGQLPDPVKELAKPIVVVPLSPTLTTLTRYAVEHALSFSDEVIAVVVLFDADDDVAKGTLFQNEWADWAPPARLVILKSQYHSVVRPLLRFINTMDRHAKGRVTVLIPEIIPKNFVAGLLHNRMEHTIMAAIRTRSDVVIATVPVHLTVESLND